MNWALRFLGVGNAQAAPVLGSACGVLERDAEPVLMIDCGQEALSAFLARYGAPPRALYITHLHMDHVGGLERLFYRIYFDPRLRGQTRLFVPAALVPLLQARVADYPEVARRRRREFLGCVRVDPGVARFLARALMVRRVPDASSRAGHIVRHRARRIVRLDRRHAPDSGNAGAIRGARRARRARLRAGRQSFAHRRRGSRARISRRIAPQARALSLRIGCAMPTSSRAAAIAWRGSAKRRR